MTLIEIATKVAVDAKATAFDLGCFYEPEWNLSNEDWDKVCELATAMIPFVEVPDDVAEGWARASADVCAETANERRQLGGY